MRFGDVIILSAIGVWMICSIVAAPIGFILCYLGLKLALNLLEGDDYDGLE